MLGDMSIDDCNKSDDENDEEGLKVKIKKLKRSSTKKGSMNLVGAGRPSKGHHSCVCNGNFQY